MGRRPCCSLDEGVNKGSWTAEEDMMLADHIKAHGERKWSSIPKQTGLKRCGKSCRLRWLNYLRPNIKRGNITHEEEDLIIRLHKLLGNRWSLIAGRIPGRTDNEIKNYWNGHLCKKKSKPENTKIAAKEIPSNEAKLEEGHSRHDYSKNKPESSDGSLLSSSTTSTTTTKHEDFSELLMEFYTRELSLSEFLDTDFTKFSSMISTATSTTATTTSQLVSMVRGDQMYQTQLHYSINEAKAPVGDDEVQFNMLNSQEIMQNSIGEDPQSDSNIGFELAAAFTDLEAEEELYWSNTI